MVACKELSQIQTFFFARILLFNFMGDSSDLFEMCLERDKNAKAAVIHMFVFTVMQILRSEQLESL